MSLKKFSTWAGKTATNIVNKIGDIHEEIVVGIKEGQQQVGKTKCCWCGTREYSNKVGDGYMDEYGSFFKEICPLARKYRLCWVCFEHVKSIDSEWLQICKSNNKPHLNIVKDALLADAESRPRQQRENASYQFILCAEVKHMQLFPNE